MSLLDKNSSQCSELSNIISVSKYCSWNFTRSMISSRVKVISKGQTTHLSSTSFFCG